MADCVVLDLEAMRANLLELAGLSGWEVLHLEGETVGGSEAAWWASLATADEKRLRRLHDAAWDARVDMTVTPAQERMARRWFREPAQIAWFRRPEGA